MLYLILGCIIGWYSREIRSLLLQQLSKKESSPEKQQKTVQEKPHETVQENHQKNDDGDQNDKNT